MTRSNRRRLTLGLLAVLLLVGTVLAVVWALERRLIYFPDPRPVAPAADVIDGARDVTLYTADGLELGAWFVPAAGPEDTGMAVLVVMPSQVVQSGDG